MLEEQIAALVAERERAEEELTDSAGSRERATAAVYLLRSSGERIALRRETAAALAAQLRGDLEAVRSFDPSASAELETAAREASADAQAAAGERARLQVEAEERWARVAAIERGAQAALAAELEGVLEARGRAEAQLTGGGRDALLALRGSAQVLAVRHESAQRLLGELRGELAAGAKPARRPVGRRARRGRRRPPMRLPAPPPGSATTCRLAQRSRRRGSPRWSIRWPSGRACRLRPAPSRKRASGSSCSSSRPSRAASARSPLRSATAPRPSSPDDARRGLELIERARAPGLGPVRVLVGRDPGELVRELPVVGADALLAPRCPP